MKKNNIIVVVVVLLVLAGIGVIGYQINEKKKQEREEQQLLLKIQNSYAPIVSSTKLKKIYIHKDNTYQKIGTLEKGVVFPLVKKEIQSTKDVYYQIAGTNYYVDYQNLKEVKNYQPNTELDSYIVTHQITTNPTHLYRDGKLMISIEEPMVLDILLTKNNQYYVKYLNEIYDIHESFELQEKSHVDLLQEISVLNFSNDISLEQLEKVIHLLKEEKKETISIADFTRWINGMIHLESNKILLLSYQELDDDKKQLLQENNYLVNTDLEQIEFVSGDTKLKIGDTKYYKYEIYNSTSIDRVKDMLNGIKEIKPVVPKVAVLNYHFFYDSSKGESCNETICLDIKNFRQQLDYLKQNNFKILTMQEFNDWMDQKIILPEKSVLITIDDGAMGTSSINGNQLIPILEEYQIPATLFLITGWWDISNYQSNYLEIHSHGDELHHNNYCNASGKCGYKGLLLSKEEIKSDLETSIRKIGSNLAFCYPFYQKNNTMVEALKETGFQLGFVGGNRKATQKDDKYAIPRYVVYKDTSLNGFISMVK